MLALVITGALLAVLAIGLSSDPEYVQTVKEAIYWLVKAGYGSEKIIQIMRLYVSC